jgi:NAD(P)-dependent dehydrogenase (short-subunit alcohol dehydrogenase family)
MTKDMPSNGRLQGRRIVVTGAASGIGRQTARLFAAEGATVIALDRQPIAEGALPGVQSDLCFAVDICDPAAVTKALADAAALAGGLDGVVNAAGIMITGPTQDVTAEVWRKVIEVNLTGTFFVTQAALPWLRQATGATVVNIASGAGVLPNAPGLAAYAASKGGVVALTKALAADLAPAIRVNCICPGMVDTPMADGFRTNVGNYALKRIAEPEEIARALMFLTSTDASYVTGATLAVDGGRTFH